MFVDFTLNSEFSVFYEGQVSAEISEEFAPKMTTFDNSSCESCPVNQAGKLRRRDCVWYEETINGACRQNRSNKDSRKCDDETLESQCTNSRKYA